VHALRAPVLVVRAFARLDRPEAHGVEPTLGRGRRDEPGTVLETELGPAFGVEFSTSLYSGLGFLPGTGYTVLDQGSNLLGPAPGEFPLCRGQSLSDTHIIAYTQSFATIFRHNLW
jgi:hypothetical protein